MPFPQQLSSFADFCVLCGSTRKHVGTSIRTTLDTFLFQVTSLCFGSTFLDSMVFDTTASTNFLCSGWCLQCDFSKVGISSNVKKHFIDVDTIRNHILLKRHRRPHEISTRTKEDGWYSISCKALCINTKTRIRPFSFTEVRCVRRECEILLCIHLFEV